MSKILFGYSSACCFYDEEDFRAEFKVPTGELLS